MKGTSIKQQPFVQNDGINLTISFNEKVTTEADGQNTYEYDTVVLAVTNNFEDVFTAILAQCNNVTWVEARNIARKALGIDPELEDVKEDKVAEIKEYDKSSAVNEFTYQGQPMWIDVDLRVKIQNGLNKCMEIGEEIYPVWNGNVCYNIPCNQLNVMLAHLEVYAIKCMDCTNRHRSNVMALTTIAEVQAYDYTVGYPDKLEF